MPLNVILTFIPQKKKSWTNPLSWKFPAGKGESRAANERLEGNLEIYHLSQPRHTPPPLQWSQRQSHCDSREREHWEQVGNSSGVKCVGGGDGTYDERWRPFQVKYSVNPSSPLNKDLQRSVDKRDIVFGYVRINRTAGVGRAYIWQAGTISQQVHTLRRGEGALVLAISGLHGFSKHNISKAQIFVL